MQLGHNSRRYEMILLETAIAWSLSFICRKIAVNTGSSEVYLFLRDMIASALLLPFVCRKLLRMTKDELRTGVTLEPIYFGGMFFQTIGLGMTTPAESSFITTSYVVMVSLPSRLLLKKRSGRGYGRSSSSVLPTYIF